MAAATAAVVVGVAGMLAVLPLYVSWWELGCAPSLNPLETGVAMEAPLLLRRAAPPEESGAADDDSGGGGRHQRQQQQQRRVNSNGGHVHIEARVGALHVLYCAVLAVAEVNEEYHHVREEDESADANARCIEEGEAGFGHTNDSSEAFGSKKKMLLKLVDEE
jgi:hypothetical protein